MDVITSTKTLLDEHLPNCETSEALMKKLSELKLEELGRGAYSIAYALNKTHALKVTKRTDAAALDWLTAVQSIQHNKYVPQLQYLRTFTTKGKAFVTIMERLKPWRGDSYSNTICGLRDLASNPRGTEYSRKLYNDPDAIEVASVIEELTRFGGEHNHDMHDGNFMLRGKQLVITDPIC